MRVERLRYRNNPTLTCALMADGPSNECGLFWAALRSAGIWADLQKLGVPGIQGVWSIPEAAGWGMTVVSIKQMYAGHAPQVMALAAQCTAGAYFGKYVIVVDDDIDPTNVGQVLWAMATRSRPAQSIDILRETWSTFLDPSLNPPEIRPWGSKALINACMDYRHIKTFSPRTKLDKKMYDNVVSRWQELGLTGKAPEITVFEDKTSAKGHLEPSEQQIGVGKAVALDGFARRHRAAPGAPSIGAGGDEGVEFAVLAARIDADRQVSSPTARRRIFWTGECLRQFLQIDANQPRLDAGRDHLARQRIGRPMPEREQRRDAGRRHFLLAVGAHVLKKQIAEHHVGDALRFGLRHRCRHLALVDLVRARIGYPHDGRRQSAGFELRPQQLLAHSVDADTIEPAGDGGQSADHIDRAGAPRLVQRPGAVLAARPGNQSARTPAHRRCRLRRGGGAGSGLAGSTSGKPAIRRIRAFAARSPDSHAPATVPHIVSCSASPAK